MTRNTTGRLTVRTQASIGLALVLATAVMAAQARNVGAPEVFNANAQVKGKTGAGAATLQVMAVTSTLTAAILFPVALATGEPMLPSTAYGWGVLLGLALEVAQFFFTERRLSEWADAGANAAGILTAWLIAGWGRAGWGLRAAARTREDPPS